MQTSAQTIRGKVTDATTGEPLVGATVSLEDTKFATIVNLDGSYVLKNIPGGKYEIKVKYSGYEKAKEKDVEIKTGQNIKGMDFQLKTESKELTSVSVKASKNVETDKAARGIEQKSDIVQNILSQKAIELSPKNTGFYSHRISLYQKSGKLKEATADATAVINLKPNDYLNYSRRGELYYVQNKFKEALTDYTKIIELKPPIETLVAAHYARGTTFSKRS